jgi:hypothetical protein
LFGYAFDGFGIYGPRGDDGKMVTNEQLDECHGHTHSVLWDGKMKKIYHYHLNNEYPYSVGCFKGKVNYAEALGSTDMKSHGRMVHGTPGHKHTGDASVPDIMIIPRKPFQ